MQRENTQTLGNDISHDVNNSIDKKPYICFICQQRFAENKPHCDGCKKIFSNSDDVIEHWKQQPECRDIVDKILCDRERKILKEREELYEKLQALEESEVKL